MVDKYVCMDAQKDDGKETKKVDANVYVLPLAMMINVDKVTTLISTH